MLHAQRLALERNQRWVEREILVWIVAVVVAFVAVYRLPLASMLPAFISAQVEQILEIFLLLTCLILFLVYSKTHRKYRNSALPSAAVSAPVIPTMPLAVPPSSPSFKPPQPEVFAYGSSTGTGGGGASGGSRRRFMGSSPQFDESSFRHRQSSWQDINARKTTMSAAAAAAAAGVGTSGGGGGGGAGGGGSSSSVAIGQDWNATTQYCCSPQEKVSSFKKLDDGRAIEVYPALRYLSQFMGLKLDQLPSHYAEKLRQKLGEDLTGRIKDFEDCAQRLVEKWKYKDAASVGGVAAHFPTFGLPMGQALPAPLTTHLPFGLNPAPNPQQAQGAGVPKEKKNLLLDVLRLHSECTELGSSILEILENNHQTDDGTGESGASYRKRYEQTIQVFSVVSEGCPLRARTSLVGICSELRSACSRDGALKLAGATRGAARGAGRWGRAHASTVESDDHLIISIFFNFCDLYQDRDRERERVTSPSSEKHSFSKQYYFSSYKHLLDSKGATRSVGIVKNDHGEFDVFVKKQNDDRLMLLEIAPEDENLGLFSYHVIAVFLLAFRQKMSRQTAPDENGALLLLRELERR